MSISKEIKQAVIRAANSCCHYCSDQATTVDHKVPSADGGSDARSNLVAACEPCNTAKGKLPFALFCRYIRRFDRPARPRNWYQNTNWYVVGAISKILANVELDRAVEIVLVKFSDGDPVVALSKIKRANTSYGLNVDNERLEEIFRELSMVLDGPVS